MRTRIMTTVEVADTYRAPTPGQADSYDSQDLYELSLHDAYFDVFCGP